VSENELGTYLRARREALPPTAVGLPHGRRRRTPGLRRAELATLAGVSVEYLARLEQGRDRNPSTQVIAALADALRLSTDERVQLRRIAKTAGGMACLVVLPPATSVRASVQLMIDRLEPTPAFVVNRLSDVIAYTAGFARLMQSTGLMDADRPNLARFVLTDPRARDVYPEWDRIADAWVANLRIAAGGDPYVGRLVDELTRAAGPLFTAQSDLTLGTPGCVGVERLIHSAAGELRLASETLTLPDADDQRLVVYLPGDEQTATALDRLTCPGPATLRAVNG
jgi:transcriptional regulator with XRE-family HTH domain